MSTIAPSSFPRTGSTFPTMPGSLRPSALPKFGRSSNNKKSLPPRAAMKPRRRVLSRADYEQFLPMVRRIAMRLARRVPSYVTVDDLISSGWVGLAESFSRTQVDMPLEELEAYASHRIKGAMLDYLRSLDPTARQIRNASRRIARAVAKLTEQLARQPEETEIAAAMDLPLEEYRELLQSVGKAGMARLEILDIDQVDACEDDALLPDEEASRRMLSKDVADAITGLSDRLQKVLMLYYQESCTLKEIGAILGVSESRVSQLHTEAMHRLRAAIGKE
jgi:RNA polymerase sigma factor for flagellar operon FliA